MIRVIGISPSRLKKFTWEFDYQSRFLVWVLKRIQQSFRMNSYLWIRVGLEVKIVLYKSLNREGRVHL